MNFLKKFTFVLLSLIFCFLFSTTQVFADTLYNPVGKSNGYKVYLSPAKHSPEKTGCNNYQESVNARKIAVETAKDLQAMGYTVMVGEGDYLANTNSSNSWKPNLHIPIHSNATTFDCSGTNPLRGGTWLMYYSTSGSAASDKILAAMQSGSPGTNDKKLTDVAATGGSLYELRNTSAVAAYVEAAFHTYGPDVNWLLQHGSVGQRITNGIHGYSGAKDCRTQACPSSVLLPFSIEIENSVVKREEVNFDIKQFGRAHKSIENELNKIINGENTDSIFGDNTKDMLNGVAINDNGTLLVDFKDFTGILGSPSSFIIGQINKELFDTIVKFSEVKEVYFLIEGSFSDWCYWLQIVEEPMKIK